MEKRGEFDPCLDRFIELVARGGKKYESYAEAFNEPELTKNGIGHRLVKICTPEVNAEIERRKKALIDGSLDMEALEQMEVASPVTKERLISECEYMMRKAKSCVARNIEGIGVINKAAADVYLKAIEVAAKLTGAYEQEEKTDSTVVVKFDTELDELAK